MAVVYRGDICRKESLDFRALTFTRTVIRHGQIAQPEQRYTLDCCSDECELTAATRLLQKLSRASSVDEQGRPFQSSSSGDPGPTPRKSWEHLSDHRRDPHT